MTEEEFFRRQDAREAELKDRMLSVEEHMKRGNAIMKRSDETMRLNREAIQRSDETMRETNQIHRDTRTFIREMTERMHRYMDGMELSLAGMSQEIKANTAVLADLKLATSQHTQALARMLDRLD